jgi:hypothetical protein
METLPVMVRAEVATARMVEIEEAETVPHDQSTWRVLSKETHTTDGTSRTLLVGKKHDSLWGCRSP